MFKLACLLFSLFIFSGTSFAKPRIIDNSEFKEPSIDKMVEWIPEQIPRTVSFYFDTDGDGVTDIIIAYYLIEAYACKEKCTIELRDFNDHWILVSSIGSNPYAYYIVKKWSMWRETEKEDWKGVKKSSASVYKYKDHDTWYKEKFLKLHPEKEK